MVDAEEGDGLILVARAWSGMPELCGFWGKDIKGALGPLGKLGKGLPAAHGNVAEERATEIVAAGICGTRIVLDGEGIEDVSGVGEVRETGDAIDVDVVSGTRDTSGVELVSGVGDMVEVVLEVSVELS